ncbi:uncharacterized protein SEPMUDRAFT_140215 [Sphaerulina musiva SO2202]|uniref:Cytochrome c oxidase assembly protein n=1 Tax=Sphaerulina musiva (strain SO2202) TaxID=692275 RepID=M3CL06_SPHMS|nr:uncharacterized protein SEPMUDRAFT_140215 [Sphaerulina musiva SO2202]EMF14463.1 hypothetical protein SEPMUDRAFT_140215 [Sphaerulina musiva SO2202]
MSTAAKLTLGGTILGTIGIVVLVHRQQKVDQALMHAGVIRDMEQQKVKRERQADFEMQRQLEEEYKKLQSVSDSTDGQVKT